MDVKLATKELTSGFVQMLSEHLLYLEGEKDKLLEVYFPKLTNERYEFENFIAEYIKEINDFMVTEDAEGRQDSGFPLVIIGSRVEVIDMGDGSNYCLRIVSPLADRIGDSDEDEASFLSPVGRALLLARINQEVLIQTPAGHMSYLVKHIEIPNVI